MKRRLFQNIAILTLLLAGFPLFALVYALDMTETPIYQSPFKKPYDIYLTENRICRKCTGRYLTPEQVELKNRNGETGVYKPSEIIGVDNHPLRRKFWLHSYRGMGLPARVINPRAFEGEKFLNY